MTCEVKRTPVVSPFPFPWLIVLFIFGLLSSGYCCQIGHCRFISSAHVCGHDLQMLLRTEDWRFISQREITCLSWGEQIVSATRCKVELLYLRSRFDGLALLIERLDVKVRVARDEPHWF